MSKRSVQHKCLGENKNDGWRGICQEVCERVFLCACVRRGADPASAPTPPTVTAGVRLC